MKKLALFDPYGGKFTTDMQAWWSNHGYEVRYERYYNPELVLWADIVFFHTADNNIKSATNPGEAILADDANFKPWGLREHDLSNKKVIVQPIDIECWQGAHNGVDWDLVNDTIFIAPHIQKLVEKDVTFKNKTHVVKCGVNLDRYKFKERQHGFDVAVISEKWSSKGIDLILQVAKRLHDIDSRYKIHWLGRWSGSEPSWDIAYFEDYIKHNDLNFEFTEYLEGDNAIDEFLDDKNYLLHASHKEAFSYATAEAMAKGIKTVTHRFFGADDIWPNMTWDTIDQAVDAITSGPYDSRAYRQYLIDHGLTHEQEMEQIEAIINR